MTYKVWNWFRDNIADLIQKVLEKLTKLDGQDGLSWEDIRTAAELMRHAEYEFGTGADRREWVIDQLKSLRQIVLPHLIELVFWLGLNFANKEGWIVLGGSDKTNKL